MAPIAHKKQAAVKYSCSVPKAECIGSFDGRFGDSDNKLHSSISEAALCLRRHLHEQGWQRTAAHTWEKPGEPIKVA